MKERDIKKIHINRKARNDYNILEKYEAGIVLTGTEVKSVRQAKINIKDSYASINKGEVFLYGIHIHEYSHGNIHNHEPTRTRKLLLHRKEIDKLTGKIIEKGLTLIPLKVYLKRGRVKIELGLAKGKKEYDQRTDIQKRDLDSELRREIKHKVRF